ncbi:hypothetical protein [Streptomyces hiroshimensis]|uniref:DUF3303 domain-containing protein n=1 Tax=Streptomyces hiroshimensis TaxID=66424 RepID=A0ABQ2Y4S9_9ACTN|nr:hypothetical protein [Streptomyces hiroshimensis]GGX61406.1 hypothetical protein GCM10010324_02660 [Streptomyces hiroshimensis]
MRMMLRARLDTHASNEVYKRGELAKFVQDLMDRTKPEAAYFGPMDGGRTCTLVFDLADPSQIPATLEALLLDMEADVELLPVMNYDDLKKGLAAKNK